MQATTRGTMAALWIVFVLVLCAATVSAPAFAAATPPPPAIYGARAMGMGGAYTAVADDATALYWNPSAIGSKFITANATIGLSGLDNLEALEALMDPAELPGLEGQRGVRASALFGATVGPFGVAGSVDGEASVGTGKQSLLEGQAYILENIAFGAARDMNTWGNGLFGVRAGLAARAIEGERTQVRVDATGERNTTEEGKGYAVDLGIQVRIAETFVAGGSVRNAIGEVAWDGQKESLPTEYRLGVAVRPPLLGLTVAADVAVPGEVRYGVEKSFLFGLVRLRAGQIRNDSETWTTAGAGLRLGVLTLDAAFMTPDFKDNTYAVEATLRF